MEFLKEVLSGQTELPGQEDIKGPENQGVQGESPEGSQQEGTKEVPAGEPTEGEKPTGASQESTEEPVKPAEEVKQPTKVKVDYTTWLQENEKTLADYLRVKNTDYSSLPDSDAVKLKIRAEHPEWSEDEVTQELSETYGVGLTPIEIDEETMSSEEIRQAREHNKAIVRGQRSLKTKAREAREFFEQEKSSIKLPELETEVEIEPSAPAVSQEDLIKQAQEEAAKFQEEVWMPAVTKGLETVKSINRDIEVQVGDTKVTVQVAYEPTEDDRSQLLQHLSGYIPTEADSKYRKADGKDDWEAFIGDKAAVVLQDKLIAEAVKAGIAEGQKMLVKNQIVNYDGGQVPLRAPEEEKDLSPEDKVRQALWGRGK